MKLLVDAGPLVAQAERHQPWREDAQRILVSEREGLILSPLTAAEVDYFLQRLRGPGGNARFLADLAAGRFEIPCLEPEDFRVIASLNERYRDLSPGLADLSIVALAARYGTTRVLTLDQRHFRAMRPLQGGVFTVLPFDQDIARS